MPFLLSFLWFVLIYLFFLPPSRPVFKMKVFGPWAHHTEEWACVIGVKKKEGGILRIYLIPWNVCELALAMAGMRKNTENINT